MWNSGEDRTSRFLLKRRLRFGEEIERRE